MRERLAVTPRTSLGARTAVHAPADSTGWMGRYLRATVAFDATAALVSGLIALRGLYDAHGHVATEYVVLTAVLPAIWVAALTLAGSYDSRIIGSGADELRRGIKARAGRPAALSMPACVGTANCAARSPQT